MTIAFLTGQAIRYTVAACAILAVPALARASVHFAVGANGASTVVTSGGAGNRWLIGAGYGVDNNENGARDLLDVGFAVDPSLPGVGGALDDGESFTVRFGSIQLRETDAGQQEPGIAGPAKQDETDNLGVTTFLTFTHPSIGDQSSTPVVAVLSGTINGDTLADLTYTFTPQIVRFGNGGAFEIAFGTNSSGPQTDASQIVAFTSSPQTQDIYATVTLRSEPIGSLLVPEPSTLLVWSGLGIIGLLFWRNN